MADIAVSVQANGQATGRSYQLFLYVPAWVTMQHCPDSTQKRLILVPTGNQLPFLQFRFPLKINCILHLTTDLEYFFYFLECFINMPLKIGLRKKSNLIWQNLQIKNRISIAPQ